MTSTDPISKVSIKARMESLSSSSAENTNTSEKEQVLSKIASARQSEAETSLSMNEARLADVNQKIANPPTIKVKSGKGMKTRIDHAALAQLFGKKATYERLVSENRARIQQVRSEAETHRANAENRSAKAAEDQLKAQSLSSAVKTLSPQEIKQASQSGFQNADMAKQASEDRAKGSEEA